MNSNATVKSTDPKEYARRKLGYCIRRAREAARNAWVEPKSDRAEYRRLRKEAMQDARYWRDQLSA